MHSLKKPVCVHFHIFKNAGTTIDWILEKNFLKNHISFDDNTHPGAILSWDRILDFLHQHQNIQAFSSHQIRLPILENTNFKFFSMIFFRHPIDRAFSIYSFKKRSVDDSIGTEKAKSMNVKEYIQWNLDLNGYMPMKNFQVKFLSNKNTKSTADSSDLQLALDRMKRCTVIGVVDRLDESLILAEECLRPIFKNIDFSYVKQNISKDRKGDLPKRIDDGKSKIGQSLMERLEKHNKLDMQLYSAANDELNSRLKNIENFNQKISDFRNRCKKLHKDSFGLKKKFRNLLKF